MSQGLQAIRNSDFFGATVFPVIEYLDPKKAGVMPSYLYLGGMETLERVMVILSDLVILMHCLKVDNIMTSLSVLKISKLSFVLKGDSR